MEATPNLAAAMAKVQAELPKLERDRTVTVPQKGGGSYSYSYATLANLSEAVLPLLAKHGLSFVAMPGSGREGRMSLCYRLMHESGEALTGEMPISAEGGIQQLGGRITYARRYCLAAVVGIAADEDDESRLADDAPRTAQRAQPQRRETAQRATRPPASPPLPGEDAAPRAITAPQRAKLHAVFGQIGWNDRDDRLRAASAVVGRELPSSSDLTLDEAKRLIDALEQIAAKPDPAEALTQLVTAARGGES